MKKFLPLAILLGLLFYGISSNYKKKLEREPLMFKQEKN